MLAILRGANIRQGFIFLTLLLLQALCNIHKQRQETKTQIPVFLTWGMSQQFESGYERSEFCLIIAYI